MGVDFSDVLSSFQSHIDNAAIVPSWHSLTFLQGLVSHVSMVECTCLFPGALKEALVPSFPDCSVWLDSYKRYSSLLEKHMFDMLSKEEYLQIVHTTGN